MQGCSKNALVIMLQKATKLHNTREPEAFSGLTGFAKGKLQFSRHTLFTFTYLTVDLFGLVFPGGRLRRDSIAVLHFSLADMV